MVFKFQILKNFEWDFSDQPFLIFQQIVFDKVQTIFLGCWVKAATLSCRFSFQQHSDELNSLLSVVHVRFFEPEIHLAEW